MSIKTRLERLKQKHFPQWEAPFFLILSEDDVPCIEALRKQYRQEIERDRARGRMILGVDFR